MDHLDERIDRLEDEHRRLRESIDGNGKPGLKQNLLEITASLAETVRTTTQWRDLTQRTLETMGSKLDELRVHLYSRPSWIVTASLSFLTALCVGLIVAMFKH